MRRELKALDSAGNPPFASVLVIRKLAAKTASNGNPFLSTELGDRTCNHRFDIRLVRHVARYGDRGTGAGHVPALTRRQASEGSCA